MSRILFVCLGNICRSPAAEGVMRQLASDRQLPLHIDSAGTGNWHDGAAPDRRMIAAAGARGIDLTAPRARQISRDDFFAFDYILAMDRSNLADLTKLAPDHMTARLSLVTEFMQNIGPGAQAGMEVPDPYYGSAEDFETVLDILEAACIGFLEQLSPC